jgi:hypothetical protein
MIGVLYSLGAGLSILAQLFLLAPFRNTFGENRALLLVLGSWTILALIIPLSQFVAVHMRPLVTAALGLIMLLRCLANFGWP